MVSLEMFQGSWYSAFTFTICIFRQSFNTLVYETLKKLCCCHVALMKSKQKNIKQKGRPFSRRSTACLATGRRQRGGNAKWANLNMFGDQYVSSGTYPENEFTFTMYRPKVYSISQWWSLYNSRRVQLLVNSWYCKLLMHSRRQLRVVS